MLRAPPGACATPEREHGAEHGLQDKLLRYVPRRIPCGPGIARGFHDEEDIGRPVAESAVAMSISSPSDAHLRPNAPEHRAHPAPLASHPLPASPSRRSSPVRSAPCVRHRPHDSGWAARRQSSQSRPAMIRRRAVLLQCAFSSPSLHHALRLDGQDDD